MNNIEDLLTGKGDTPGLMKLLQVGGAAAADLTLLAGFRPRGMACSPTILGAAAGAVHPQSVLKQCSAVLLQRHGFVSLCLAFVFVTASVCKLHPYKHTPFETSI
jgi:hypothetical protein